MLIACLPLVARPADVQVTSSTQSARYSDYLSNNKGLSDVSQSFRLNALHLDDQGKMSMFAYGNIVGQTASTFETPANNTMGRLYYMYLDYRDVVKDHLDVRLGRTYIPAAAIAGTVDGLHFDLRNVTPMGPVSMGITGFGGHQATFYDKGEIGYANDVLWGGSVYAETIRSTRLEASYSRKLSEGVLARENVALDLSSAPFQMVNVTGRVRYDTLSSRYSEVQAGVSVTALAALVVRGDYFGSTPTFDQYSFYKYFSVQYYQQLGVSAEYQVPYRLLGDYRLSARYANERFDATSTAHVIEAGVSGRMIRDLMLNVSYEARRGYAGRLSGVRASGTYRLRKTTLLAGVDFDDFGRDAARVGTAKKYYAGVGYDLTKKVGATVRLEENNNFYSNNLVQGFLALNVKL
jgi:hypothetical protein